MNETDSRVAPSSPPPAPPTPPTDTPDEPGPREARWLRPVLAVVAVLGLLLLGAAGGLLLGMPSSSTPATPGPDSVDVGFAQDMSVHHHQAVAMASWERDHTSDPVVRQLAADIETTQTSQIGRMQGWLELWGASGQPIGPYMTWMSEPGGDHSGMAMGGDPGAGVTTMPGMATDQDLANLRAATGSQLDVLFLQLMLRHHLGGAGMLDYGAQHAALPQVRNLAAQMRTSQSAEADFLRQLLTERGGQPLPA